MGDIADYLEIIDSGREADPDYDPNWFIKAAKQKEKPSKDKHYCKDWPCTKCNSGF